MKLAINPDGLEQDPNPGLELARALRLEWIEVRSAYGRNILTMSDEQISAFRKAIISRDLKVAAIASPLWKWGPYDGSAGPVDSFGFPTELSDEEKEAAVRRALTVAQRLNAPIVRVFSGLRSKPSAPSALENDPLFTSALKSFSEAGIALALENEPVCKVATGEELLSMARSKSLASLSFWFDIGNYCAVNGPHLDPLASLAPRIRYAQVKDFKRAKDGKLTFCAVGQGEVPIGLFLDAIFRTNSDLCVCVETEVQDNPGDAVAESIGFLRAYASNGGLGR
jgi:sugar phosphate isomerase/epimerase